MIFRSTLVFSLLVFLVLAIFFPGAAIAQAPEKKATAGSESGPEIRDLGDERFQIGNIIVDKAAGKFTVPGKVLRLEPPLEYLAVKKGGAKGYESLLELESSAVEFNLACILIGMSNENITAPQYQFDQAPVAGPNLHITAGFSAIKNRSR